MNDTKKNLPLETELDRRGFVAVGVSAGLAAATAVAQGAVVEENVEIKTADGTADAAFIHPATGSYPGVLIWADAFGLRPALREMAKRLAADGYSVLVPNPFYRVSKAPQYPDASVVNFGAERAKIMPMMQSVTADGNAEKDAAAYIAFLDANARVNRAKKIGTQGYCMGGPLIMRTAGAFPDRIGAAASFHGGGLVTAAPNSPHLLAPKIKARMYFGVASNDDAQDPQAKVKLKEALDAAKVVNEIEVYQGVHGWCMPDAAGTTYHKADAEKAWAKLLALYKAGIA